jgi:hypothetical protein
VSATTITRDGQIMPHHDWPQPSELIEADGYLMNVPFWSSA